jgi:hypothetical protein
MPVKALRCGACPAPDATLEDGCEPWRRSQSICGRTTGHPPPHRSPVAEWEDGGGVFARRGASVLDQVPPPETCIATVACPICGAKEEVGWGSLSTREEALAAFQRCGRCDTAITYTTPEDPARPDLIPWRLLDVAARDAVVARLALLVVVLLDPPRAMAYVDQLVAAHVGAEHSTWPSREDVLRSMVNDLWRVRWSKRAWDDVMAVLLPKKEAA